MARLYRLAATLATLSLTIATLSASSGSLLVQADDLPDETAEFVEVLRQAAPTDAYEADGDGELPGGEHGAYDYGDEGPDGQYAEYPDDHEYHDDDDEHVGMDEPYVEPSDCENALTQPTASALADVEQHCAGEHLNAAGPAFGQPPLLLAIEMGNVNMVQKLMDMKADINVVRAEDGWTALMLALTIVQSNDEETYDEDGNLMPTPPDKDDKHAEAVDNAKLVSLMLIEAGADLTTRESQSQWNAVMFAIIEGQVEALEAMIARGADMSWVDEAEGHSPLMFAVMSGHVDMVRAVLKATPEAIDLQNNHGFTALMESVFLQTPNALEITTALLEAGADVTVTDESKTNAYMFAVQHDVDADIQDALADALAAKGIDAKSLTMPDGTPLDAVEIETEVDDTVIEHDVQPSAAEGGSHEL